MESICTRVYNNGERKVFVAYTQAEVDFWIKENSVMRFGCSMFVDSKLVYKGYHSVEECAQLEVTLTALPKTTPTRHVETDNPNGFIRTKLKYPSLAPPVWGRQV